MHVLTNLKELRQHGKIMIGTFYNKREFLEKLKIKKAYMLLKNNKTQIELGRTVEVTTNKEEMKDTINKLVHQDQIS